jgi:hypothetical protein
MLDGKSSCDHGRHQAWWGERPAGEQPLDSPMVQAAVLGVAGGRAEAAFSAKARAMPICRSAWEYPANHGRFAAEEAENAHSLKESVRSEKCPYLAVQRMLLMTLALVGIEGVSEPLLEKRR